MRSILVTGFAPFSGLPYNPSSAVLAQLPEQLGGFELRKAVLPVDALSIGAELERLYRLRPRIVLHTGLALDRPVLTVERVARNQLDFDCADNRGNQIRGKAVIAAGPQVLATRFPVPTILKALQQEDIRAEASDSAGTFLCNQTLYHSLYHLPKKSMVGFIHLAADEALAAYVGWAPQPLERQARALRIALEVSLISCLEDSLAS